MKILDIQNNPKSYRGEKSPTFPKKSPTFTNAKRKYYKSSQIGNYCMKF